MTTTTTAPRVTRSKNVTYLGVPAKVWDVLKNSNRLGERVSLIRWVGASGPENGDHPAGTVTARHMRGDGRYPAEFSLYAHVAFHGEDATERATAWAVEQITSGAADTPEAQAHAAGYREASLAAAARHQFHQSTPTVIS